MATKNVIEGSNKVSASQLKDFFRQIDEGGITGDHIQALLERKNPFEESITTKRNFSRQSFKIEIDGTKTLVELMKIYGCENTLCSYFSPKYFIIKDKTKRTSIVELFSFNKSISTEEIIKEMIKEKFRPAKIEEMLSLVINQTELQTVFTLIALGSVANCDRGLIGVPTLPQGENSIIGVTLYHRKWGCYERFVGVRNDF
jgi:hypothetical protein